MCTSVGDETTRKISWQPTNFERFIPRPWVTSVSVMRLSENPQSSQLGISIYFRDKLIYLFPRLIHFAAKLEMGSERQRNVAYFGGISLLTDKVHCTCNLLTIIIIGIQPLGRFGQRPELSQSTGIALVRCILGKFLGVVCHCFPPFLKYTDKSQFSLKSDKNNGHFTR